MGVGREKPPALPARFPIGGCLRGDACIWSEKNSNGNKKMMKTDSGILKGALFRPLSSFQPLPHTKAYPLI